VSEESSEKGRAGTTLTRRTLLSAVTITAVAGGTYGVLRTRNGSESLCESGGYGTGSYGGGGYGEC